MPIYSGLDDTEYSDIKLAQVNGKSEGALINFKLKELDESLEVFTTRPDTIME